MYLDYWNLRCLPFENTPDCRFFFASSDHKEASTRLQLAIQTRKLIFLLTGDYGVGKTLVCENVIHELPANTCKVVFIRNPRMDALDLMREMAYQLGEEVHTRSNYDALHTLNNLMGRYAATGRHTVVFLDEAQLLLNASILEDLRLLLNNQADGRPLMTLILSGQTELGDLLRSTPQMMQRIAMKYHIHSLQEEEVGQLIAHRMRVAGGSSEIFEDAAIHEVAVCSKGNPREINGICDLCLLIGSLKGESRITPDLVRDAWEERS